MSMLYSTETVYEHVRPLDDAATVVQDGLITYGDLEALLDTCDSLTRDDGLGGKVERVCGEGLYRAPL